MLRQKLSRRSRPIRRRSSLLPIHAPAAAAACSSSRPSRPAANHVTDRPHLASQSGSTPRDRKRSIPHTHRYRNPVPVSDPPRSRSAKRVLSIAFLAAHSHHSRRRGCSISFNRPHQQPNSTRRSAPLVRTHLLHRDQIPITCGTLSAQLPAGSFPGGFRTTAPVRVASSVNGPSSETLHRTRSGRAHSISSSARSKKASGSVSPMALAVLMFMASSNLVANWTGKSAALAPGYGLTAY